MTKKELESGIREISEAISVSSDHAYLVYGKELHVAYQQPYMQWNKPLHHFGQNEGDETQMKLNLKQHLTGTIYNVFYCPGSMSSDNKARLDQHEEMPSKEDRDQFMDRLSSVNHTIKGIDPYWSVYALGENNAAFVMKNGQVRQLIPGAYQLVNPAEPTLKVQSMVHIIIEKENRDIQPTFYHIFSQELISQQAQFIRIYFNIEPEGSIVLVDHLTTLFNKYQIPFSFKCLNHPSLYTRSDSAVLYLDKIHSRLAFVLLQKMLPGIQGFLKKEIPLFTKKISHGVSFAEDPGAGQSFGMSRSTMVAEGILNAYSKGLTDTPKKATEIKKSFVKNGLDIDQIYLRPNSKFPYDFLTLN